MTTFDLSAKVVTNNQKAWVIHAGAGQQHSADFKNKNAIFLESPYLELSDVKLNIRGEVRRALRRSQALDNHKNTFGSAMPSNLLSDYDNDVFKENAHTALAGGIARMFGLMKKGDIIMSPSILPSIDYNIPVINFGEVVSDFDTNDILSGAKPKSQMVPFRKVSWLNAVPRKDISWYLERKIGKPPALREISIDKETEEILQHTYKSYIYDNTSSGMIEASKYDGADFITLTDSQRLIAILVAAHHVFSGQQQPAQITDLDVFVRQNFKNAAVDNIVIDFASPGYWQLIGAPASMVAFVGLGIAILTSNVDLNSLPNILEVTNSVSIAGDVEDTTKDIMKAFLNSIDNLELAKARKTAHQAKDDIGLTSNVLEVAP